MKTKLLLVLTVSALAAGQAGAATIDRLVYKLTDTENQPIVPPPPGGGPPPVIETADADASWLNAGGVNEGVLGADAQLNNGIDFKDAWVDDAANWAMVDSIRVSMWDNGSEVAFLEFAASGTTKNDFFDFANLTGSSWGASGPDGTENVFSIAGDATGSTNRNWFVNDSYGGCLADVGYMAVVGVGSGPCAWDDTGREQIGDTVRGFVYSESASASTWGSGDTGYADLFTVQVSYEDSPPPPTPSPVPVPAAGMLLLSGLGGIAFFRRFRKRS